MTSEVMARRPAAPQAASVDRRSIDRTWMSAIGAAVGLVAVLAWACADVRVALKITGRLGLLVFLVPLIASPLHRLRPSEISRRLVRHRRRAGLAYGVIQALHVLLIAGLLAIEARPGIGPMIWIFGGTGMLLAFAMFATSFRGPARWLGPQRWRALHRLGLWFLVVVYAYDFAAKPWLEVWSRGEIGWAYLPFSAALFLAVGLRMVSLRAPGRRRAA